MKLQAQEGRYLTENFDTKERRFIKSVTLTGIEEAGYWKEVTEEEMNSMKAQAELLNVNVTYQYLKDVKTMLQGIHDNINSANLTADEALDMQEFYPDWCDVVGNPAPQGFRFNYQGTLLEVVTSHTLSEYNPPVNRPMLLPELSDDSSSNQVVYFKAVTHTQDESEESGNFENEKEQTETITINV